MTQVGWSVSREICHRLESAADLLVFPDLQLEAEKTMAELTEREAQELKRGLVKALAKAGVKVMVIEGPATEEAPAAPGESENRVVISGELQEFVDELEE